MGQTQGGLEHRATGLLQSAGEAFSALPQRGGSGPVKKEASLTIWTSSSFDRVKP